MKWDYKNQLTLSVVIILLANIVTEVYRCWIYRSIGFGLCGLLFLVHPVLPAGAQITKTTIFWTRMAGVVLILIGVFTRVHFQG